MIAGLACVGMLLKIICLPERFKQRYNKLQITTGALMEVSVQGWQKSLHINNTLKGDKQNDYGNKVQYW